jgi:hypothetical protein
MSLLFYGVIILGIVLGGLVLLVLFSLLTMAKRGDEYLERMELELLQTAQSAPFRINREKSGDLHGAAKERLSPICTTAAPPEWGFFADVESGEGMVVGHRLLFTQIRQDR